MMSRFIALLTGSLVAFAAWADDLHITTYARDGTMDVTNTFPQGVLTMQKATALDGSWSPEKQAFSLGTALRMNLAVPETTAFFRALAVDLTPISSWLFSADDMRRSLKAPNPKLQAPKKTTGRWLRPRPPLVSAAIAG